MPIRHREAFRRAARTARGIQSTARPWEPFEAAVLAARGIRMLIRHRKAFQGAVLAAREGDSNADSSPGGL